MQCRLCLKDNACRRRDTPVIVGRRAKNRPPYLPAKGETEIVEASLKLVVAEWTGNPLIRRILSNAAFSVAVHDPKGADVTHLASNPDNVQDNPNLNSAM